MCNRRYQEPPSFSIDHCTLNAGLYLREDHKELFRPHYRVWDLRFVAPREHRYMTPAVMHSIEHLFAFKLRMLLPDQYIGFYTYGCQPKGSKVLMYDETFKDVSEIKEGDFVMGLDGTPNRVNHTIVDRTSVYRITSENFEDFFVSDNHILTTKHCTKLSVRGHNKFDVVNLPIQEVLKLSDSQRNYYKIYRSKAIFSAKELIIPPYILGLWLGDGVRCKPCFCVSNSEPELHRQVCEYAASIGCHVNEEPDKGDSHRLWIHGDLRGVHSDGNPFMLLIKELNLFRNKHIPEIYKKSSEEQRLQLLAGLINSDGWCGSRNDKYKKRACINFSNTNKQLIDDIVEVARSLGMYAESHKYKDAADVEMFGTVCHTQPLWFVTICDEYAKLSKYLLHKKIPKLRTKRRDWSHFTLSLESPCEEVYGFVLENSPYYLDQQFCTQHNCQTGFSFVSTRNLSLKKLAKAIIELIEHTVPLTDKNDIPALTELECGQPTLFNLESTNLWLIEYKNTLCKYL